MLGCRPRALLMLLVAAGTAAVAAAVAAFAGAETAAAAPAAAESAGTCSAGQGSSCEPQLPSSQVVAGDGVLLMQRGHTLRKQEMIGAAAGPASPPSLLAGSLLALPPAGGSLNQLLAVVKDVAVQQAHSGDAATNATEPALANIFDYANGIISDAEEGHKKDLQDSEEGIQNVSAEIESCKATTEEDTFGNVTKSRREAHEECRDQEVDLLDDKEATCKQYEATLANSTPPLWVTTQVFPPTFADVQGMLQQMMSWATEFNATLMSRKEACDVATEALADHKLACHSKQAAFETQLCAEELHARELCAAYDICTSAATSAHADLATNVRERERTRKAHFGSAKHILCFARVLNASVDRKAQLHKDCVDAPPANTSHLDMEYPSLPHVPQCDAHNAPGLPCTATFLAKYYTSKEWFKRVEMANCTPCPDITSSTVTTTTATTLAAPTPTPAPASTPPPLVEPRVYSSDFAFLALDRNTGKGQCWGYGGNCDSVDFTGVTDVYSNGWAFFALDRNSGKGQCWGHPSYGGNCDSVDFTGVTDVYSSGAAFLALDRNTGKGQCWRHPSYGGNCDNVDFTGVTDVYSTRNAFLALDRNTGTGQCWGRPSEGGNCDSIDFSGLLGD